MIYVDGAGAQFPGQQAKIAVVNTETGQEIVKEIGEMITNNQAEYTALIEALKQVNKEGETVFTDSQLVAGQLTANWKVKAEKLRPFVEEAKKLLEEKKAKLIWVRRCENKAGFLLESKAKDQEPDRYNAVISFILERLEFLDENSEHRSDCTCSLCEEYKKIKVLMK